MADNVRKRAKETEEQEAISGDPPPVASLDGDEAKQQGSDYWDLDDDGDWGGSNQTSVPKHRRVLRRSTTETGIAFLCHLVFMCFYIYVHVYDATIFKRNKGVGFDGAFTYGGRWKYLTYNNLWIQFLYFFLCFFVDIMPYGSTKVWSRKACDVVFTTLALPLSIFVTVNFWGIYAIDRELIYPSHLDQHIPYVMNHLWHTTILVCVLVELVLVFHRYPTNFTASLITFGYSFAYMVWIVWVYTVSKEWVYPFLAVLPLPALPVFFVVNFFVAQGIYFTGKGLCYLRWKERHQVLDQLGR